MQNTFSSTSNFLTIFHNPNIVHSPVSYETQGDLFSGRTYKIKTMYMFSIYDGTFPFQQELMGHIKAKFDQSKIEIQKNIKSYNSLLGI